MLTHRSGLGLVSMELISIFDAATKIPPDKDNSVLGVSPEDTCKPLIQTPEAAAPQTGGIQRALK